MDTHRLALIREILAPYAGSIDRVAVFGSHATGRARPNSDIDLVIHGVLEDEEIDRIWTDFGDSALPVSVDVIAYSDSLYPPLKAHIDRVEKVILTQADLLKPLTVRAR